MVLLTSELLDRLHPHVTVPRDETITSIEFRNFKALSHFSVSLQHMNVLVGPNNSGKSTVLSALRALAEALKKARAKSAERVSGPAGTRFGYRIMDDSVPISVENVHTDYEETDTRITFRLSNKNSLELFFPRTGGCILLADTSGRSVTTPAEFKRAFPLSIGVVPVLGPLEHEEEIRMETTVRRGLTTHLASRHFRNYWYYNPNGFDDFADMIRQSWPGMDIRQPSRSDNLSTKLVMFAEENRIPRELYWAGFGFQVWCQLLTHISRASDDALLVVDEPEIYLHPDVQRQLLAILRDTGPDVVLATHSTEIMGEADPGEILLIDKTRRSAQRLRDIASVQAAMDAIGSIQNITLTRLARNRRVLFVEGAFDYKVLRRFARLLGMEELATGTDITPVESGGFTSWERVRSTAWGIEKTLGGALRIAAIFDRDFFPQEQVDAILADLSEPLELAHIHARKEMENYLLVPSVLERAFGKALSERNRRSGDGIHTREPVSVILDRITSQMKGDTLSQYQARRSEFLHRTRKDTATINAETFAWFEGKWGDLETRMEIVRGKDVLCELREYLQTTYQVNLTDVRIIDEFRLHELPHDLVELLKKLDQFRSART